jgi:2-polyprenyl-3-methyl-5-hydroxy-6-metoxy-1,4-benzoquinol methylase
MLLKSDHVQCRLTPTQEKVLTSILNKLANKEYKLTAIPCICGKHSNDELITNNFYPNFVNSEMNVVLCKHCGTMRTTPYMTDDTLVKFYTNDYRALYNNENLTAEELFAFSCKSSIFSGDRTYIFLKPHVDAYKIEHNKNKLKIFEIGTGYGGNLYHFHQDGEDVYGCDYGDEGLKIARSHGMVNVVNGDMDSLKQFGNPDVIIINHVLEHIVDLESFLKKLHHFVNENTLVYMAVPGICSISFRNSNYVGGYAQIAHVWHFSTNSLDYIMAKSCFTKIEGNEIIQAIYKKTDKVNHISLKSEYEKNKALIEIFDNHFIKEKNLLWEIEHNNHEIEHKNSEIEHKNSEIEHKNSEIDNSYKSIKKLKSFKRRLTRLTIILSIILILLIIVLL